MNNSIPDSVLHFYQLAHRSGIILPKSLSIYEQIRLYICRAYPDTPERWPELEQQFIDKVMRSIPEPLAEDAGDMSA
jgi:hypothetical protein